MSGTYLLLYKYLENRYADTVVLTFAEIEDLLGFALPEQARLQREWWTDAAKNVADPITQIRGFWPAGRPCRICWPTPLCFSAHGVNSTAPTSSPGPPAGWRSSGGCSGRLQPKGGTRTAVDGSGR